MAKIDLIVGSSIIIYFATTITELVSSVPVGLTLSQFGGNCILHAKTNYIHDNKTIVVTSFGSTSSCEFCTYLTIVTILYSLGYGSYSTYAMCKSADNATLMWVLPTMMICFLLLVLKFISSCVLSIGFSQFCKSVVSPDDIKDCQSAQNAPFQWAYDMTKMDSVSYYAHMATAQSASWFCVFEWFLLTGLAFLHYRRNIKLRSSGDVTGGFGATDTQGIVAGEVLPST